MLTLDKWIHLGVNPSLAAVALFGNPIASFALDKLYILWYLLKPLVLAYFAMTPDRRRHAAFFTAYFAMWIFGGALAVAVPSLGPIYTHPEWFFDLNAPSAARLQAMLMTHYQAALADPEKYRVLIYEGIAAFPSLHVGIAAVFAFFVHSVNRKIGMALFIYLGVVQIGSVLLGWHYAIDGYVGILLAFLLYKISGSSARRDENDTAISAVPRK